MDNRSPISELTSLLQTGRRHVLPKGQVLGGTIWDNLGIAMVESGYLKRYLITREGNQSILVIYGPGYVFPFTPVYRGLVGLELYDGDQGFYYEAMSKAVIRSINLPTLQDYCDQHPEIYKELFYLAGTRLNMVIAHSETVSLGNSYRRLAHQLVYFANTFGQQTSAGTKILVPLTVSDLASVLNIARETVSRCLSRMKQKGLIKTNGTTIIADVQKLRREIY